MASSTSFAKSRSALFAALATACDQIEAGLQDEQDERGGSGLSGDELEALKERATDADRLEAENRELRRVLDEYLDRSIDGRQHNSPPQTRSVDGQPQGLTPTSEPPQPKSSAPPSRLLPPEPPQRAGTSDVDWEAEHRRLAAKYNAVRNQLATAKQHLQKRVEDVRRWTKYAESLERKLQSREKASRQEPRPTSVAEDGTSVSRPGLRSSGLDITPGNASRGETKPSVIPAQVLPSPLASGDTIENFYRLAHPADATSNLPPVQYEGTTDEASDGVEHPGGVDTPELPPNVPRASEVVVKSEPSSDPPVVVFERPVRKRKRPDTEEKAPVRVKSEQRSSPDPLFLADQHDLDPHESMDLDEVGQRLSTPRKRREYEEAFNLSGAATDPAKCGKVVTSPSAARRRPQHIVVTRSVLETSVLSPISGNKRIIKTYWAKKPAAKQPPQREGRDLRRGIRSLAEDQPLSGSDWLPGGDKTPARSDGRLAALLNTRAPDSEPPPVRSVRRRAEDLPRQADDDDLRVPRRRDLPFGKQTRAKAPDTPQPARSNPPTAKPQSAKAAAPSAPSRPPQPQLASASPTEQGGLRSRSPSALRPDDFKINPASNSGQGFAFSEVVRGRDDRAALPGCTDPGCCGPQFRALARAQHAGLPDTAEQRRKDQALLERFLGDGCSRLVGANRREREELLLDARTWDLANRTGRHRHRFARMASPPGFWRTDFPDTQEMEEERREAEKRERETVAERYREAMRPGGRWMFRDE